MAHSDPFIAPDTKQLNKSLPGFRFETIIASSDTSAVYLATQTSLDRHVALRLYSPAASENPDFVQSVESMAQSMARLNHPNLISIFDSGRLDGMIYLVMEFVAGKSLARSLGGHAIDHAQAKSITAAICEGIAHAHQFQIAHGRLTADDILLNPSAEPKIGNFSGGDFASASILDIIHIGKLLYRMLTGSEHSTFSPMASKLAGSPPDLDEFCNRCIERNRDDAFQTMQELCDALAPPKPSISSTQPTRNKTLAAHHSRRPVSMVPASPHHRTELPPPPIAQPGFNWILARNIIIIIILLFAIKLVMGITDQKKRALQERQKTEQQEATKRKKQPKQIIVRPLPNNRLPDGYIRHAPAGRTEQQPESKESPEESLKRLRPDLANAVFAELPAGSHTRGSSAYLPVEQELSWPQACLFAEQHGAHLAFPTSSAELDWLAGITNGKPFWLGAGRSGRITWSFLDGSPWTLPSPPSGLGNHITSDKHGFVRAVSGQNRLPFILQWRLDGSKPATLEARLSLTAATLKSETPIYPAGTHFVGERAYLIVARESTWPEAKRLAERSGGHLAVISDTAEFVHLRDLADQLDNEHQCWLGAVANGDRWEWVTGETWLNSELPTSSNGMALASSHTTWLDSPSDTPLGGFIIEWSRDQASRAVTP